MVPDVDVPKYYETIARKADRVNTLSEDLFMLLKMESAEYQLNLQTLDLSELTRQICAEYYEEITNAGFSFSVEIPEEAVWIQGDGRLFDPRDYQSAHKRKEIQLHRKYNCPFYYTGEWENCCFVCQR